MGLLSLPLLTLGLGACGESSVQDLGPAADQGTADIGADTGGAQDAGVADTGAEDTGASDTGADAGDPDMGAPDAGQGGIAVATTTSGPIDGPPTTWTWVDVPDARCANDTPTGFGVNINPNADRLMIFLTGGNACFNAGSCFVTANLDGYGLDKFRGEFEGFDPTGLPFDRNADENIFKDYSYAYFPYCSGDTFAGSNPNGMVGNNSYTFVGYNNVALFLQRLTATFPNVSEVVLAGASAGGFGAAFNFDQVAEAFGMGTRVTLMDDSGPLLGGSYLASCLQAHFRQVWSLDQGPLADCPTCIDQEGAFTEGYGQYLFNKYPSSNFAFISSSQDEVIRGFFGYGLFDCRDLLPGALPPAYPGSMYAEGLLDARDRILGPFDNAQIYIPDSTRHVWVTSPLWETTVDNVVLSDWLDAAIEGDANWSSVPAAP